MASYNRATSRSSIKLSLGMFATVMCIQFTLILSIAHATVHDLHDGNFNELIDEGEWFIEFFAPWCSHCVELAPVWEAVADELHQTSAIRVAKVDCTLNPQLAKSENIEGFPTIRYYHRSSKVMTEFSASTERSKEKLIEWVLRNRVETPSSQPRSPKKQVSNPIPSIGQSDEWNAALADLNGIASLYPFVTTIARTLLRKYPIHVLLLTWLIGVFNGMLFGILYALREKRDAT